MKASYSDQYRNLWHQHWWWQSRHRMVTRALEQVCALDGLSTEDRSLLDVGCAGGVAFDAFSTFGNIRGIEPDTRLVDFDSPWAASVDVTYFDSDYEPVVRPNVILMLDVLEHIEDDDAALEHVHRLLSSGGTAILTVPALPSLWSEHDEVNLHFRRYTRGKLKQQLHAAGFEIESLRYMFGWPLGLMYARRLLAKSGRSEYAVQVPPWPINTVFRLLTLMEECVCNAIRLWPVVGSSLVAIVRRPNEMSGREAMANRTKELRLEEDTKLDELALSQNEND
jgi:2-polyprenyl-3-methyl-5-hydroxy-6-metoxy-1,4-benzoquinol methylase